MGRVGEGGLKVGRLGEGVRRGVGEGERGGVGGGVMGVEDAQAEARSRANAASARRRGWKAGRWDVRGITHISARSFKGLLDPGH